MLGSATILTTAVLAWPGAAEAAPETFNTALPVAKGAVVFREQAVVNQSGNDPSWAQRDRTVWSSVSVLGYGLNSDLALFGVIPYVNKRIELTKNGARRARSAHGVGDISLFGRYTAYKRNFRGGSFRVAPFVGVKLPTGANREKDSFGLLPAVVQPGSGSWDPFAGVVLTYQTLAYQFDAQASYKANTRADNFEFGDVARLDTSFQYRIWPRKLEGGVPGFVYAIMEANLIHQDKNQNGGISDPDTNGTRLFLVPGLQYVTKDWIAEAAVQLPVVQDLNGTALENDYISHIGFRVNF